MPYTKTKSNPFPLRSKLSDMLGILSVDWQKWFNKLTIDLVRVMSSYDSNCAGITTLVAGAKVILNDQVTAASVIRLSPQNAGAGQGFLSVTLQLVSPNVGFTITSSNVLDNRTIFFEILEAF